MSVRSNIYILTHFTLYPFDVYKEKYYKRINFVIVQVKRNISIPKHFIRINIEITLTLKTSLFLVIT